ncbi:MAG: hemolysin III family protein [Reyranella sp.]|nr:MAG: hemolysin III family protein [Reyranella sp.]
MTVPSVDPARRADAIVHALGLTLGAIGATVLLVVTAHSGVAGQFVPVLVYVVGLVAMLGCSAAYNLRKAPSEPRADRWRDWLRRFDHAAIFVMIAGTYTPLVLLRLPEPWATGLTVAIWAAAALGIAAKLLRPRGIEALSVVLYLLMGWIGLVAIDPLLASVERGALILVLVGGLVYSGGVVFHLSSRLRYQRALWHASVLVAASIHYAAILSLVVA